MKNLTDYSDKFIQHLIEQNGGNIHRCTASVQLDSVTLVPHLDIWQEFNWIGWDEAYTLIYSIPVKDLTLCETLGITPSDIQIMIDFQNEIPSPDPVHDEEAFIDELLAEDYYATLRDAMPNCFD